MAALTISGVQAADAPKRPVVFLEAVQPKESFEKFVYPAQVTSRMNARFAAEGDGVVTRIVKDVGMPLRKGETILIIQNNDASYNYAPLRVRASVSGVLATLDVSVGSQVVKGQPLGNLVDPANPKVLIEVPAGDLSKLKIGQKSELRLEESGAPIELKISTKAPIVDPATGTGRVELSANGTAARNAMVVGRLGRVEIRSDARMGIRIPQDAVVYRDGKQYIRKIEKKADGGALARFNEIQLGQVAGEDIEVTQGIVAGDSIVVRSSAFVADGQEVEIFAPAPPAGATSTSVQTR